MLRPRRHRRALFIGERVLLVNSDNPGETSARVVQEPFNDRKTDAEPRHTGCDAAPDVVEDPWRNRWLHQGVEPAFEQVEAADRAMVGNRKGEVILAMNMFLANPRGRVEDGDRLIRKWDRVFVSILRARASAEIKAKGMTVFARIDHAARAAELGLQARPTELLIFGSAKADTPLMQANQAIGIDLPLKALVFEDAAGKVWLSYNDPRWLAQRHGLGAADIQTVDAMAAALNALATKATKAP